MPPTSTEERPRVMSARTSDLAWEEEAEAGCLWLGQRRRSLSISGVVYPVERRTSSRWISRTGNMRPGTEMCLAPEK